MPLDVMNIVASQVILSNATKPPDPETTARVSVAAGLVAGPMGLVLPILASRQAAEDGGGQEDVIVPNVVNKNVERATNDLEESRLNVKVLHAFSAEHEKGIVVRQSPAAGTSRALDSTVDLTVSDGDPPENGDDNDDDETVSRAEFEAAMKKLEEKLDRILKAHSTGAGGTSTSESTSPASSKATGGGSSTALTTSSRTKHE